MYNLLSESPWNILHICDCISLGNKIVMLAWPWIKSSSGNEIKQRPMPNQETMKALQGHLNADDDIVAMGPRPKSLKGRNEMTLRGEDKTTLKRGGVKRGESMLCKFWWK